MRRVVLSVVGWVLLLTGVVLFLPGPGLLLVLAGLLVLADQHPWAERRVEQVRALAVLSAARGVRTHARAWVSIAVTGAVAASGLLWIWAPPQPAWWVLPSWTWLPGGPWTGVSQVGSGLVTLGLALWAYRRFHGRPEAVAALVEQQTAVGRV